MLSSSRVFRERPHFLRLPGACIILGEFGICLEKLIATMEMSAKLDFALCDWHKSDTVALKHGCTRTGSSCQLTYQLHGNHLIPFYLEDLNSCRYSSFAMNSFDQYDQGHQLHTLETCSVSAKLWKQTSKVVP
ncbi:unnamed protein product [Brugia pahangi]|uniref:Uncharacterized protein n=1 Tax=Brugia pahangi TaxID=6280 RepID=A0A0N4T5C4_BRUPA|nr:unnamed protein product [Brugia pahangi]